MIPKHHSTHNQNENYDGNDGMIDYDRKIYMIPKLHSIHNQNENYDVNDGMIDYDRKEFT